MSKRQKDKKPDQSAAGNKGLNGEPVQDAQSRMVEPTDNGRNVIAPSSVIQKPRRRPQAAREL